MPRPTKGSITEHVGKDGLTYRSLRFTAYGKRRRVPLGPISDADAGAALRHALADVERGVWKPPATVEPPPEAVPVPSFHEFAEEWWTLREGQLAPKTRADSVGAFKFTCCRSSRTTGSMRSRSTRSSATPP